MNLSHVQLTAYLLAVPLAMASCDLGSGQVPLVETPMSAETVIDVPYTVIADENASPTGTTIETADATLVVGPGAVATDTRIQILRLDRYFQANPYASDEPGAISAQLAGKPVDFGPAGLVFDSPVTITIPYDPAAVTETHSRPTLAYWTGTKWVLLDSLVDPVANTVTVRLASFDGIVLQAVIIGVGAAAWVYAGVKIAAHDDPVISQKAAEYVTPNDPSVKATASRAQVDGVSITDKAALAQYLEGLAGKSARISVLDASGTPKRFSYASGTGANWQKPGDFLSDNPTGTNYDGDKAIGKMRGDCTDVTNATVSWFRSLGYEARSVFGYNVTRDEPHAWAEVIVGGTAYITDERGNIQRLEEGMKAQQLLRAEPGDKRNFMWDESGQVPYRENWWADTVKAITYNYGGGGGVAGEAMRKGLTDFGSIQLSGSGDFSVTIPSAEKSFLIWPDIQAHETISNLVLKGKWNNASKTGTFALSFDEHVLMVDWGQGNDGTRDGNYGRITEDYEFVHSGDAGVIDVVDDNMRFKIETQLIRTGTKTEERVVVEDGQATVVGSPVVTDRAKTSTKSQEIFFSFE